MPSTGFHTPNKAHFSRGPRGPYAEQGTPFDGLPHGEQDQFFSTRCHTPNGTHAFDRLPYAKQEGVNRLNVRLTVQTRISYKANAMFA